MTEQYYVYMLRCADGTLYAGTTNDLAKRMRAHNSAKSGARYTKGRRPVTLVYSEECTSRSAALIREYAIKKFTRSQKLALIG